MQDVFSVSFFFGYMERNPVLRISFQFSNYSMKPNCNYHLIYGAPYIGVPLKVV